MSQNFKTKCGKLMLSLLVAGISMQAIMPTSLLATTLNVESNLGVKQSVKVNESNIKFEGIESTAQGEFILNATLERSSGIPKGTSRIDVNCEAQDIEIGGKKYMIYIFVNKYNKLSDTEVKLQMPIYIYAEAGGKVKNISLEQLNAAHLKLSVSAVRYYAKANEISQSFKEQLKKVTQVKGVSLKEGGFELLKGEKGFEGNILPEKGLNIPIAEGSSSTIDNIGFINGKLQIRTKEKDGEGFEISAVNSNGKSVGRCGGGDDKAFISIYDLKDAAALAQCTFKVDGDKLLVSDKEAQSAIITL